MDHTFRKPVCRHLVIGIAPFKAPFEEVWKPCLDGRRTREEALAALVTRTGAPPK